MGNNTITFSLTSSTKQFWFIGVSTRQSLIMRLFPIWAKILDLRETLMHGVDLPPGARRDEVHNAIKMLHDNPAVLGALITTHKLAVWEHASDLFAEMDEHAKRLKEVSCISRNHLGRLVGHAKDVITSKKALEFLIPSDHWEKHPSSEILVLGCGGAGTAILHHLSKDAIYCRQKTLPGWRLMQNV